jgi:hypothetical protein
MTRGRLEKTCFLLASRGFGQLGEGSVEVGSAVWILCFVELIIFSA